jgi:hypothetical protein
VKMTLSNILSRETGMVYWAEKERLHNEGMGADLGLRKRGSSSCVRAPPLSLYTGVHQW